MAHRRQHCTAKALREDVFGSDADSEADEDDRTFNFYNNCGSPAHVTWEHLLGEYYFSKWFACDVMRMEEPGLRDAVAAFLGGFYVKRYKSVFEDRYHVAGIDEAEHEWNASHPNLAWWDDTDGTKEFVESIEQSWNSNVTQGYADKGDVDGCQDADPPGWEQIFGAYYFEQWLPYECGLHEEDFDPGLVHGLKGFFGAFYAELYRTILDDSRLPGVAWASEAGARRARSHELAERIEREWNENPRKRRDAAGPSRAGADED